MTISPPTHRPVRQGRRPSVELTTARRSPTTRKRPGVLYIPARLPVARAFSRLSRIGPEGELARDHRDRADGVALGASSA